VTSQTDGNKQKTTYARDVLEQPVEVIDPLERKTTETFDAAGNLKTKEDPDGRTTTYAYDKADRRRLKFGIANLLVKRLKEADPRLAFGSDYLKEVVQPGNIVVTSNWDFGIEHYARLCGVPVRWRGRGTRTGELVVLKLHGAIDWTLGSEAQIGRFGALEFSPLSEQAFGPGYRVSLPSSKERELSVLRIKALEEWGSAWRRISSRTREPYIVTMARGKTGELGPLREIWRDAYEALSRAQRLEIVGYSLPDDDVEIRTMLRAAVRRGKGPEEIIVRNPAPDVHVRFRRFLRRKVESNYLPVDAV
jgi:YD repeat-containing protein